MSSEYSEQQESLQAEVERSTSALDDLEQELHAIDAGLEELAQRNHQYEVLSRLCRNLEELEDLGATDLFWHAPSGPDSPAEHLQNAHRQIDEFKAEIASVEEQRATIIGKINEQNDVLDYLHYDLRDVLEQQERKKNEWLIEREPDDLPTRVQVMPWSRGCEEDRRFKKSLGTSLAASFAIAFLVGTIALPIVERTTVDKLPERVAKLVRQERIAPPAPVEVPIIPEQEIPEPEPELADEQPPEVTPEAVVADAVQPDTREQVKTKGILAFRDSFASRASLRPTAQLGSQASISSAGENSVGRPSRSMVTTSAPGSSGGINLASISRDVGGGGQGIGGVEVGRVASSIGGGSGGSDRPVSGGGAYAGRTDEEIQIVFDRYKAALYRLYNRELRKDPTLRGQLVLRLTIEPDGSVSLCQLQSSDMDAPTLAQQVVQRVQTFDFGYKEDIVAMTIIYPIDFLPSA
ncbi:MAG: AgmX/PglI C-terminal domain-containing protein [Gammaproteobacteria bacterium]|nr:AgmX/PglI C-terminal domain-containing protein [Gammaproteobacteria bacterium]MBT8110964.1 AgmX/PglI C-terminal domain-containing protein [Gammaproteobacteria bacterium]NND48127.1 AgmX/PglI C-terminal domain-containing protein [Woeseiaceae bacterium]NNL45662.1 AgmX/PglI C-terminal domain-containing protein [Woeseiaceae bacterium]